MNTIQAIAVVNVTVSDTWEAFQALSLFGQIKTKLKQMSKNLPITPVQKQLGLFRNVQIPLLASCKPFKQLRAHQLQDTLSNF